MKQNEALKKWILKNWGKPCKDKCNDCPLCGAWECFDYLKIGDEDDV